MRLNAAGLAQGRGRSVLGLVGARPPRHVGHARRRWFAQRASTNRRSDSRLTKRIDAGPRSSVARERDEHALGAARDRARLVQVRRGRRAAGQDEVRRAAAARRRSGRSAARAPRRGVSSMRVRYVGSGRSPRGVARSAPRSNSRACRSSSTRASSAGRAGGERRAEDASSPRRPCRRPRRGSASLAHALVAEQAGRAVVAGLRVDLQRTSRTVRDPWRSAAILVDAAAGTRRDSTAGGEVRKSAAPPRATGPRPRAGQRRGGKAIAARRRAARSPRPTGPSMHPAPAGAGHGGWSPGGPGGMLRPLSSHGMAPIGVRPPGPSRHSVRPPFRVRETPRSVHRDLPPSCAQALRGWVMPSRRSSPASAFAARPPRSRPPVRRRACPARRCRPRRRDPGRPRSREDPRRPHARRRSPPRRTSTSRCSPGRTRATATTTSTPRACATTAPCSIRTASRRRDRRRRDHARRLVERDELARRVERTGFSHRCGAHRGRRRGARSLGRRDRRRPVQRPRRPRRPGSATPHLVVWSTGDLAFNLAGALVDSDGDVPRLPPFPLPPGIITTDAPAIAVQRADRARRVRDRPQRQRRTSTVSASSRSNVGPAGAGARSTPPTSPISTGRAAVASPPSAPASTAWLVAWEDSRNAQHQRHRRLCLGGRRVGRGAGSGRDEPDARIRRRRARRRGDPQRGDVARRVLAERRRPVLRGSPTTAIRAARRSSVSTASGTLGKAAFGGDRSVRSSPGRRPRSAPPRPSRPRTSWA